MSSMLDLVVSCITKPSESRSEEEINYLLPWLRKMSDKFESLKPEVLSEILKNCSYSVKVNNDIIIRQGDKGDCFYVILSGRVSIFINTEAVHDDPEDSVLSGAPDEDKPPAAAAPPPTTDGSTSKSQMQQQLVAKKELDRFKYGNFIAKLESGKAFGELALINTDCIRNASIIADEQVQLLKVHRELYNCSMREAELAEFGGRMRFVSESPLFCNWLSRYRRQAAFSLRKERFRFGDTIASQGSLLNGLIFVIKGQAKVVVNSRMHALQFPSLHYIGISDEKKALDISDIERSVDSLDLRITLPLATGPHKRLDYSEAELRVAQRNIELCIITEGEIIGDLEQGLELSTYTQSVIAIETTEVYVLDAKNFERLVNSKRNQQTLQLLRQKAADKVRYRCSSSSGCFAVALHHVVSLYSRLDTLISEEDRRRQHQKRQTTTAVPGISPSSGDKALTMTNATNIHGVGEQRGPLIDMYGPGSVFYRNKLLRQHKRLVDEKKKNSQAVPKVSDRIPNRGAAILTTDVFGHLGASDRSDSDSNLCDLDHCQSGGQDLPKIDGRTHADFVSDWETAPQRLQDLETRIRIWLVSVSGLVSQQPKSASSLSASMIGQQHGAPRPIDICAHLKGFKPKDLDQKLIPGKKIILTPKRRRRTLRTMASPATVLRTEGKDHDSHSKVFVTAKIDGRCHQQQDLYAASVVSQAASSGLAASNKKKNLAETANREARHYSVDDYKQLKQLMKKKEQELQSFQMTLSI